MENLEQPTTSLSKKLLTRVLSVYFVLTFLVTLGQIFAEYVNAKRHIQSELQTLQNTFSASLTRAIWELNTQQAITIAEGLLAIPVIEGVVVRDENEETITELGKFQSSVSTTEITEVTSTQGGLFGYTFPLIFEFSGRATLVGEVTLFSSRDVIINRIEVSIYFLIGNAIIKTAFLLMLFLAAFRRFLSEPLAEFTYQMENFDLTDLDGSKLNVNLEDKNELTVLQAAYNGLIDDLVQYQDKLNSTQRELREANQKLDEHNLQLEQEVAKKTATLSQAMLELEQQKTELEEKQIALTMENNRRKTTESKLKRKHDELASSMENLKAAENQLVASEKMASLGGLVAGIAHDVNTPLGISVTAASFLEERLVKLQEAYDTKSLTAKSMAQFIQDAEQTTTMLMSNLNRASELVASFKQIAVDQTSEAERDINLYEYVQEIIQSLHPKLKQKNHKIDVHCPESLKVRCSPGILAQIFTNMIMNSVIHGFEDNDSGHINIRVDFEDGMLNIVYKDNGKGMDEEALTQLFKAFYTTKRETGGSGLGTHIMYNLVKQSLSGEISASSEPGKGLEYNIKFPVELTTG